LTRRWRTGDDWGLGEQRKEQVCKNEKGGKKLGTLSSGDGWRLRERRKEMMEQMRPPNGKAVVGASKTRVKKKASEEAWVVTKKDKVDRLTTDIFFLTLEHLFSKESSIAPY
jgi:hypothetical protein